MRTYVFAGAGALLIASGMAYGLQATRSGSGEQTPSAAVPITPSTPASAVDDSLATRKVRTVSILQEQTAQETPVAAVEPLVSIAKIEQPAARDEVASRSDVSENGSTPPALMTARTGIPSVAEVSDEPSSAPTSIESKSEKPKLKKRARHDNAGASDLKKAKSAGRRKDKNEPPSSEKDPAPATLQAASSASPELPNPFSKLRQLFGAE